MILSSSVNQPRCKCHNKDPGAEGECSRDVVCHGRDGVGGEFIDVHSVYRSDECHGQQCRRYVGEPVDLPPDALARAKRTLWIDFHEVWWDVSWWQEIIVSMAEG